MYTYYTSCICWPLTTWSALDCKTLVFFQGGVQWCCPDQQGLYEGHHSYRTRLVVWTGSSFLPVWNCKYKDGMATPDSKTHKKRQNNHVLFTWSWMIRKSFASYLITWQIQWQVGITSLGSLLKHIWSHILCIDSLGTCKCCFLTAIIYHHYPVVSKMMHLVSYFQNSSI